MDACLRQLIACAICLAFVPAAYARQKAPLNATLPAALTAILSPATIEAATVNPVADDITITGTGFRTTDLVTLGGVNLSVISRSDTSNGPTSGKQQLTNPAGRPFTELGLRKL